MKADPLIRRARAADAELLAPLMRAEDAAEVLASHGHDPLQALRTSLASSEVAYALELAGELAALFGVVPGPRETFLSPPSWSRVWLLTGRAVAKYPLAYVRASRAVIGQLLRAHPVLTNMMDARYGGALRWARMLGAELQPAEPYGVAGLPFHRFTWRA